ncbi:MARCKS-related protein 1-B isoform X2 [Rhinoraja longicauda]
MGSTLAKSKQQENGHVKINGDASPTGETVVAAATGGDCAAEAGKESPGDGIEPAPPAEGETKAETPKKKKKKILSFKTFKLGKMSFKRGRRGEAPVVVAAAAGQAEAAAGQVDEPRAEGQLDTGATDTKPGAPETEAAAAAVEEPSAGEERKVEGAAAAEGAPGPGPGSPETGSTDAARDHE